MDSEQKRLENHYAREIEVLKRDDRLDTIAKDIVYHFPRRGFLCKGMVVSVDKFTTVKMYDKVNYYWKEELKKLNSEVGSLLPTCFSPPQPAYQSFFTTYRKPL